MTTEELRVAVESRLRAVVHESATVKDMVPLTGGASRQMWLVRTDGQRDWRHFILRRDHPSDPDPAANAREAEVLLAARSAGVPSPEVLDYSSDAHVLGTPFLMLSFVEGETIARKILRDERFVAARTALPAQLGAAIGAIHGVDVQGLQLPELVDPVASLTDDYDDIGISRPALLLGLRELWNRSPAPAPRRTLVHGDFRMGNLMVDNEGLAAVLDWEMPHIGDPFEDLGYVCMRAWRFGGPGRVAGVGDVGPFLDAYESVIGFRPTADQLTWWEARSTAWWGIGCLRQMQRSVPGHSNELELLAIGRRTAEQEYDLLELLYPNVDPEDPFTAAGTPAKEQTDVDAAGRPTLFTSPSAADLLAGVEAYLAADLVEGVGEPNRFKARIATNVVRLLMREQGSGEPADRWFRAALARLGVESEEALSEKISALEDTSEDCEETRSIVAVLKTAARFRLAVSNPVYVRDRTPGASKQERTI